MHMCTHEESACAWDLLHMHMHMHMHMHKARLQASAACTSRARARAHQEGACAQYARSSHAAATQQHAHAWCGQQSSMHMHVAWASGTHQKPTIWK